jgi:LasA protease
LILQSKRFIRVLFLSSLLLSGCFRPGPGAKVWQASGLDSGGGEYLATETAVPLNTVESVDSQSAVTPTPNDPVTLPTLRTETVQYTVQAGDSLAKIGLHYQVTVDQILQYNQITNPDQIEVGLVLMIPPPSFDTSASAFKIIPDSELIYSPSNADFDIEAFVNGFDSYLANYQEAVGGKLLSGVEVLKRVATEYSVNPRILLTVLDYQSGWVTKRNPDESTRIYPMGFYETWHEGLYLQLSYAANLLNEGYYLWKIEAINVWTLSDNTVVEVAPTINAGTAGVLNLMRCLTTLSTWEEATSENGIYVTYTRFFGYPFDYAYEPVIPDDLTQLELQLPFKVGDVWSLTSGPHAGWASGSAWAALDFAPPGDSLGCKVSASWVVASAPGEIVYSQDGAVVQDLDGDGIWQTGWSILYMHISSWERVEVGIMLEAGDPIGHASCEGGISTGTHLHIARRYNGEWISADADLPFVMDGWVSAGYGVEYNGYLVKGDQIVEAWDGRSSFNAIQR